MTTMKPFNLPLDTDLKRAAAAQAKRLGVSLSEYIRRAVRLMNQQQVSRRDDPAFHPRFVPGRFPKDGAARADDYIYGKDKP